MPSFNVQKDIPDLTGKVYLVTGANSGLGEATVAAIAQHNPHKIYLTARSLSKGEEAVKRIQEITKQDEATLAKLISIVELDLSSLESVKVAANKINQDTDRLDVLILNAGISGLPPAVSKEGYELTFGVNYLGHVLLTQLLMPKLLSTSQQPQSDVRVVVLSSVASKQFAPKGGILFDEIKTDMRRFSSNNIFSLENSLMVPYGQANVARTLFAYEMAQRYPEITFASVHPGTVRSNIWQGEKVANPYIFALVKPLVRLTGVLPDEGAKCQLWCAFSPDVENGAYYEPVGKRSDGKYSRDDGLAKKLWKWTDDELKTHGAPGWPAVNTAV